jgi:alkylation response protein AidB-like acyl-CoA dehydrogenase
MDLDLSQEQATLLSGIEPLLARHRRLPDPATAEYFTYGDALDRDLAEAGFYGAEEGFALEGADAGLVLDQVSQSPFAVPAMASLIVAPGLGVSLPRPIALMAAPDPVPVRFLAQCRTALIDAGDAVLALDLEGAAIEPVTTIFAYPYAALTSFDRTKAKVLDIAPERFRDLWRLGLVFEILGALRSAHALTVDYVKQREQFKRAIGSFQAVQHRLAEGATHIEALHYLGLGAALSGDAGEIALAGAYAQKQISQIIFDCHQFHGAMGLTLEYVLHHWTYRLKVLAGELGGPSAQARRAAQTIWEAAA